MQSYSRRIQLETWNELLNKRHDPMQPVSEHLDFIHERFCEMEKQGFSWTKSEILGILFQVGLPDSFPNSFNHVNDLLDQKVKSSGSGTRRVESHVVRGLIESEERRMIYTKLSLCSLPVEVLVWIIKEVYRMPITQDTEAIKTRTITEQRQHEACEDRQCKALRPLASVNRQLYQLCMPFVWKALTLTHGWRIEPNQLVKDLLPHVGEHVERITLQLSKECYVSLQNELDRIEDENPYNWDMDVRKYLKRHQVQEFEDAKQERGALQVAIKQDRINVSPEILMSLLEVCPNLQRLSVKSPTFYRNSYSCGQASEETFSEGITILLNSISPLLLKLRKLRHLEWDNQDRPPIPQEVFHHMISHLPLLQSLAIRNFPGTTENQRFILAPSKGLSHQPPPNLKLTGLQIFDCNPFDFPITHTFIQHFSLSLTHLKVFFKPSTVTYNIPELRFCLPSLTELHLRSKMAEFVLCFGSCPNVKNFTYDVFTPSHSEVVHRLLSSLRWPDCKNIQINRFYWLRGSLPDTSAHQLIEFCDQNKIDFDLKEPPSPDRALP